MLKANIQLSSVTIATHRNAYSGNLCSLYINNFVIFSMSQVESQQIETKSSNIDLTLTRVGAKLSIATDQFQSKGQSTSMGHDEGSTPVEVIEPSFNHAIGASVNNDERDKKQSSAPNGKSKKHEEQSVISKLSPIKIPASPTNTYAKLTKSMANDSKWAKEVSLGKRIGLYKLKGELGSGNFSHVKMAVHQLTKDKVAIKTLDCLKLDMKSQRMLKREIAIMEQLCHPNLIQLFEVIESRNTVYLAMELADEGELFAKITNEGKMNENECRTIFLQVVSAVDYMHSRNVIHRDLKAENIYFKGSHTVKVGDFGFSTQVTYMDEALRTFCGSPPYAAPELFQDESYVGAPVDLWALGVLLYFMICGYMPFRAPTVISLKKAILESDFEIPSHVATECQNLIRGFLKKNYKERFTMANVVESSWLRYNQNYANKRPLVVRRPSGQRPISGKGIPSKWMYHPWPVVDVEQREPLEAESRLRMAKYGFTDDDIERGVKHGCRDPVMGIYRITAHNLHYEMRLKRFRSIQDVEANDEFYGHDYSLCADKSSDIIKSQVNQVYSKSKVVSMKRKSTTCNVL
ncbi:G2-specific protein kinase nim-1 [Chamberlinius hualienensis]